MNTVRNDAIRTLHVVNYGCIRQASFQLTPLHALIGPNDSGKSTALRALRTLAQFAVSRFHKDPETGAWPRPFDPMLEAEVRKTHIAAQYRDGLDYAVTAIAQHRVLQSVIWMNAEARAKSHWDDESPLLDQDLWQHKQVLLKERLTEATMVRFNPDALRSPCRLILAKEPIAFTNETGLGLASVLQAFNSRDVDTFVALRDEIRRLFPNVDTLVPAVDYERSLRGVEDPNVTFQTRLTDGTVVPADALSEGLLYFLGFAALGYLEGSSLFLIEKPENGLHPSLIAEVMGILRNLSKTSQVVITTDSPLVVNELEGHEITVVHRAPEQGTCTTVLRDVPGFEDAMKVYRPGEFWVSYCDGNQEKPLLTGTPRLPA